MHSCVTWLLTHPPHPLLVLLLCLQESASGTPVLSKEEVNDLCRMVQDLLGLEELAKQLAQQLGRQPSMDEWAAAAGMGNTHRFQMRLEQGQRAKQMMVSSNLRLVASICRSYADAPGAVMQDLVAEGIAGLIRGVERFEPERGFRFSTYAHWWIRQGVNKAITEQGRAVRLPQHLHENVQKMQRTFAILSRQLGRKPTTSEVATALDWTVDKIQDLWELMKDPSSLEQPSFDEPGAGTLGDTIEVRRGRAGLGEGAGSWAGSCRLLVGVHELLQQQCWAQGLCMHTMRPVGCGG
jgi:RNA polymerase sigma factor (sigma-70 family)